MSPRLRAVSRTIQTRPARAPPPYFAIASCSSSTSLRRLDRAAAPTSPNVFQHSPSIASRRTSLPRPTSVDRHGSFGRVGISNCRANPAPRVILSTSSCIARCPSAPSSCRSRSNPTASGTPRARPIRSSVSTSTGPLPRSIRLTIMRPRSARRARSPCVHFRRRRMAMTSPPSRAPRSFARRAASTTRAERRIPGTALSSFTGPPAGPIPACGDPKSHAVNATCSFLALIWRFRARGAAFRRQFPFGHDRLCSLIRSEAAGRTCNWPKSPQNPQK